MQVNASEATRQIYWNISHIWLMYVLFLVALAIAVWGLYRRWAQWRQGAPLARFDHPLARLGLLWRQGLLQVRTARDRYAGFLHRFIFGGWIVLLLATTVVALDADLGLPIMRGLFYLVFQSFLTDLAGALVLVGLLMAAGRRWLVRPPTLVYSSEATGLLLLLMAILGTGFLVEGARIAATGDPWAAWSPFGHLAAWLMAPAVGSVEALRSFHRVIWWVHLALSFGLIAWLPYTKLMHVLTGPLNIYTASLEPVGAALKPVSFEENTTFGVNALGSFTWKDLLDADACTECGRCTAACPANTAGKDLSPRDLILGLRTLLARPEKGAAIIDALPATARERLWQCTTCAACMEACPVLVEQMPKIVDLRRYLVMEEADFPESMQEAITSLESRNHPFRGTQASRLDWADGLELPGLEAVAEAEVLLWVGCSGALVERNQKAVRATAQLLAKAGVSFAVLGRDERCCGDPARRIGNEFLFESLARENIAAFQARGVRQIVTACPHCFNTLRHEYPRLGSTCEVRHHSEFLQGLVAEGKLQPGTLPGRSLAYHDPCYLGRHNGIYDAPRQLLQSVPGLELRELPRCGPSGFCCGGGGGLSFTEEPPAQRVSRVRSEEILETGVDLVAVGCPFCMSMLEDGINAGRGERDVRVLDLSEVLLQSMG